MSKGCLHRFSHFAQIERLLEEIEKPVVGSDRFPRDEDHRRSHPDLPQSIANVRAGEYNQDATLEKLLSHLCAIPPNVR